MSEARYVTIHTAGMIPLVHTKGPILLPVLLEAYKIDALRAQGFDVREARAAEPAPAPRKAQKSDPEPAAEPEAEPEVKADEPAPAAEPDAEAEEPAPSYTKQEADALTKRQLTEILQERGSEVDPSWNKNRLVEEVLATNPA